MKFEPGNGFKIKIIENKVELPLLSELLDLADQNKLKGEWFIYYPTKEHKKNDVQWWSPRSEMEKMAKIRMDEKI